MNVLWNFSRRLFVLLAAMMIATSGLLVSNVSAQQPVITRDGAQLKRDGKTYTFTGVNAYQLATYWPVNEGCGGMLGDAEMDAFFASLRPNSVVRFWAFQDQAINKNTGQRDWTAIDRVFRSAEKNNQYVLPVIANHYPECDGGALKTDTWYEGGYTTPFSPDGKTTRVSYQAYMQELVGRYKDSSALGMWSLINEPEMSCGKTAQLRNFFDTVGAELKSIDNRHLLEMGVIGGNQCSVGGSGYTTILASSQIDVATYHDYHYENVALPTEPTGSSLADRIRQARAIGKPIIVGEAGIFASKSGAAGCMSLEQRSGMFQQKIRAAIDAGASGYLPWNWVQTAPAGCTHDIEPGDPTMQTLRTIGLPGDPNTPTNNDDGTPNNPNNTNGTGTSTDVASQSGTSDKLPGAIPSTGPGEQIMAVVAIVSGVAIYFGTLYRHRLRELARELFS